MSALLLIKEDKPSIKITMEGNRGREVGSLRFICHTCLMHRGGETFLAGGVEMTSL